MYETGFLRKGRTNCFLFTCTNFRKGVKAHCSSLLTALIKALLQQVPVISNQKNVGYNLRHPDVFCYDGKNRDVLRTLCVLSSVTLEKD